VSGNTRHLEAHAHPSVRRAECFCRVSFDALSPAEIHPAPARVGAKNPSLIGSSADARANLSVGPIISMICAGKAGETFDTEHRFMSPWLHASPFLTAGGAGTAESAVVRLSGIGFGIVENAVTEHPGGVSAKTGGMASRHGTPHEVGR
jgi:hypothetical protein